MLESRRLDFLLIFFLSVVELAILGSVTVKLQSLSTLLVKKPVLMATQSFFDAYSRKMCSILKSAEKNDIEQKALQHS